MRSHSLVVDNWVQVGQRSGERDREVAALFDQHYDGLCDLASMILSDRHLAEEIVMEALLKTYTGWGRIRDKRRSDVYLKRAVVNLCRSRIRRKMVEARQNAVFFRREERKAPDWDPEVHETSREVWEAVKNLPPRQRTCIVLHYVQALPESEIAEIMDCSVGTVRSQLSRARGKLQVMLKPGHISEATG
jgi:RNA polymerase sigma-70 factor (sigma-E family)